MAPGGGGAPRGMLGDLINRKFGSYGAFKGTFSSVAESHFGSGWLWLILKDNDLRLVSTSNADTPIAHGEKPLLTMDLWEHAYYLDYKNHRAAYADNFLAKLANWKFAEQNLQQFVGKIAA